jgi:hypothetical protein
MRFWVRNSVVVALLACGFGFAQTPSKPAVEKTAARKVNELTLAGLRPGQDTVKRAERLYGAIAENPGKNTDPSQAVWIDNCGQVALTIDHNRQNRVEVIRATKDKNIPLECIAVREERWRTGRGLRIGDGTPKVLGLYGEPDSRSPSTRNGQPLELWYYAFDWAGENVPQVMEVLCTREADGKAGQVVEITLAAPSL